MKIFIFYGVGGHAGENWFPWIHCELEALGHEVIIPPFPTPEGQTLENWLAVLDDYKDAFNEDCILIGHSLGCPFALNVLECFSAKACFLVSCFVGVAGNPFDESMKTFAQRDFDWNAIRSHCGHFEILHGDNDPYLKLSSADEVAAHLGIQTTVVEKGGHLNSAAGYDDFPLLLERLKTVI